jgi:dihydroorotate dehydrogenase (fumarate)
MDLSTTYLGFKLAHPLIPGASPLAGTLDRVRQLEEAGAPMIVLASLFEEQIKAEQIATNRSMEAGDDSFGEALSYLPKHHVFALGPEEYLEHVAKVKKAVSVPVVASLNGTTPGAWVDYAKLIQQAGADALELNIYDLATDLEETGDQVERRSLEVVRLVKAAVRIPVAVKLSPFYSSPANFAHQLDRLKVNGIVLFNRLYQPDIDVEALEVLRVNLSSSGELLLRLRWLAALSGRVQASLAATGGVHTPVDAVKALMTGAQAVQVVSVLLHNGPGYLRDLRAGLAAWLEQHEYNSVAQLTGSMSLQKCPDPKAFERANYMQILHSWRD